MNATYDENDIHRVISSALLAGRMPPGAKLAEQQLAALFGVSRERLRKVFGRLREDRLIDVIPNRGAFVAAPSLDDARAIYEARRILEGGIVMRLAELISADHLAQLDHHLAIEDRAHLAGDRAEAIQLSAAFHMLLAEMSGNAYIIRQMQEAVARTAMLVAFFEHGSTERCGCEEHRTIADALRRRDPAEAARAMVTHLSLIETRLQPRAGAAPMQSVETVLREFMNRKQSRRHAGRGKGTRSGSLAPPPARIR